MNIEKVVEYIKNNNLIDKGDNIIVGLSGGPDSVCLFFLLNQLAKEWDLKLYPVHVNHGFRGESADRDQNFSEDISKQWGWCCRSFYIDCNALAKEKSLSAEEAGRMARYQCFADMAKEVNDRNVKVAIAQNMDDQAETVLFRVLRGTGVAGISAMAPKTIGVNNLEIIRPLLNTSKAEILDFLEAESIDFCIDHTNEEELYTRNKLRLSLLPKLEEEFNPSIKKALCRLADLAREDGDYLDEVAGEAFNACLEYDCFVQEEGKEHPNEYPIIILEQEKICNLNSAISKRVIQMALRRLGMDKDFSFVQINDAFENCKKMGKNTSSQFSLGYRMDTAYGRLIFYNDAEIRKEKSPNIDNIAVSGNMRIRRRRPGDLFEYEYGKHKKLKDFFIDEKIPKIFRDIRYVIAEGNQVLLIPTMPWEKRKNPWIAHGFPNNVASNLKEK